MALVEITYTLISFLSFYFTAFLDLLEVWLHKLRGDS